MSIEASDILKGAVSTVKELSSMSGELSRVTVVEKIYYQLGNEEAFSTITSYARVSHILDGEDQVYQRKEKFSKSKPKKDLNLGWLQGEQISLLSIKNLIEIPLNLKSEEFEVKDKFIREHTLFLMFLGTEMAAILPGESLRFVPLDQSDFSLTLDTSCDFDPDVEVTAMITAIPKTYPCL